MTLGELKTVADAFHFPSTCRVMVPTHLDHAADPPDGFIAISRQHVKSGFRFPVPSYLIDLLNGLEIAPFQLTPNSYAQITTLSCIFLKNGLPPPISNIIQSFFFFKSTTSPYVTKRDGIYYITARNSPYKAFLPQKIGKSNVGDYKSRWFYASCLSLLKLVNFEFNSNPGEHTSARCWSIYIHHDVSLLIISFLLCATFIKGSISLSDEETRVLKRFS